jgi:hypothetical protein
MEDVMSRACGTYGRQDSRVLVGRPGGKGSNTRPNLRWDDKIIVHLNEKENVGHGLA